MTKENLAIIPARGGSKGIPKKNIVPVAGKPLIAYAINAALAASSVNRVVVSTDDMEIADESRKSGAEVVMRPADISGDLASSESALLHVLQTLQDTDGYFPDIITFLQCTSPLTTSSDIDGTVEKVASGSADSAFAAVPFHYYLWREDQQGHATAINHEIYHRPMRQEREPQYLEAGAVYVMDAKKFLEKRYRFFGRVKIFVIPESHCFEIDEPADLTLAEALLSTSKSEI